MSLAPASPRPGAYRTARIPADRFERGFTLLELVMVMFIIGLIMTIALPNITGISGARVRSEARRLSGRATFLYEKAAVEKVVYRLIFHLDSKRNGYEVARLDPYDPEPKFVPVIGPATEPVLMPAGVRVRDVTVEGIGTIARGMVATQFYPGGYVDATIVHLSDAGGNVYTLFFDPLTGRVSIEAGDIRDTGEMQ
ncbi:MAG: pilus assembly FimT family protein [Candidatus Binataceae bacterium]